MIDLWRVLNPKVKRYSYIRKKNKNVTGIIGSRIDYALFTTGMANWIEDIDYQYGYKLDHSMIQCRIILSQNKRGPGYWKFNNLLLRDECFVKQCNEIIERCINATKNSNPDDTWEYCISKLIAYARVYSRDKSKNRKAKLNSLIKKLANWKAPLFPQKHAV